MTDVCEEIVSERGERYKVFKVSDTEKRYICRCKPIHYIDDSSGDWKDIDNRLQLVTNAEKSRNDCIASENQFSTGFRLDKKRTKMFGIRYRGRKEDQFEVTPLSIELDDDVIHIPEYIPKVQLIDDYNIEHVITEDVSIKTQVHEAFIRPYVKTPRDISNFKILEQVHLTGFKIVNTSILNHGVKEYIQDEYGKFVFENINGNRIWIPTPFMWDDNGNISYDIHHKLIEIDGAIYYEKKPTEDGCKWLKSSNGVKYIDSAVYYSELLDGFSSRTSGTWMDAIGGSSITSKSNTTTGTTQSYARSQKYNETTYICVRSWFWFDTSGIGSGNIVNSAIFYARGWYAGWEKVCLTKSTQSDIIASWTSNACSGSEYGNISWNPNGYNAIELNSTGLSDIDTTGTTKICLREYNYDYLGVEPIGMHDIGGYYADYEGTSYDPYIVLTVSSSSTPNETNAIMFGANF